jgi:hypothetical protein
MARRAVGMSSGSPALPGYTGLVFWWDRREQGLWVVELKGVPHSRCWELAGEGF